MLDIANIFFCFLKNKVAEYCAEENEILEVKNETIAKIIKYTAHISNLQVSG